MAPDPETSGARVTPQSTLTCPDCGHAERLRMPSDSCQWFHRCTGCGLVLRPRPGDCCVFCSYGDVSCPPVQTGEGCCG